MAGWDKHINSISLVVGDLERAKTFYREVFGLLPLDQEADLAIFGFSDLYVALRQDPAYKPPRPRTTRPGAQGRRPVLDLG